MSGSSRQLTLKKGASVDQVVDLLWVQVASYLERSPLIGMMPLHLHVNRKSDYDDNGKNSGIESQRHDLALKFDC